MMLILFTMYKYKYFDTFTLYMSIIVVFLIDGDIIIIYKIFMSNIVADHRYYIDIFI